MANIEQVLKDVVLGSVGAVATVVEKGGELARSLVEKGQETVRDNQETVENIRRKVRDVCEAVSCGGVQEDKEADAVMMQSTDGLRLTCSVPLPEEQADVLRALLEQGNEADDTVLRVEGPCRGVWLMVSPAALPENKREEFRAVLAQRMGDQEEKA